MPRFFQFLVAFALDVGDGTLDPTAMKFWWTPSTQNLSKWFRKSLLEATFPRLLSGGGR